MRRLAVGLLAVGAVAVALAGSALGSRLIDRNATGVRLEVNTNGEALLVYRASGRLKHVLVWGAVNALPPSRSAAQVRFQVDYAGGWGKYHSAYWQRFVNQCEPYDGPALPDIVTEC